MPKGHESKLFIVQTTYTSGRVVHRVMRTRAKARRLHKDQAAKRNVAHVRIVPATWGPDA